MKFLPKFELLFCKIYMWLFNVIKICVWKDINVGKVSEGVEGSSDRVGEMGELDDCAWNASYTCMIRAKPKYNE